MGTGVIDGVTTNPPWWQKKGKDPVLVLKTICSIVSGPVNAEVVGLTADVMIKEAKTLSKIHKNIVIKIPMIRRRPEGCQEALSTGDQNQCDINIFRGTGASGSKGRRKLCQSLCRTGLMISLNDGMEIVAQIIDIYDNYLFETEIIVAKHQKSAACPRRCHDGRWHSHYPYSGNSNSLQKHLSVITDVGLQK